MRTYENFPVTKLYENGPISTINGQFRNVVCIGPLKQKLLTRKFFFVVIIYIYIFSCYLFQIKIIMIIFYIFLIFIYISILFIVIFVVITFFVVIDCSYFQDYDWFLESRQPIILLQATNQIIAPKQPYLAEKPLTFTLRFTLGS